MTSLQHSSSSYKLQIPQRPRSRQLSLLQLLPYRAFQWTTMQTFSGTGSQKTDAFSISDYWRIVWNCNPAVVEGQDYIVVLQVDMLSGRSGEGDVRAVYEQKSASEVVEIYGGGQVCLYILSGGEWTVQVQEWKQS